MLFNLWAYLIIQDHKPNLMNYYKGNAMKVKKKLLKSLSVKELNKVAGGSEGGAEPPQLANSKPGGKEPPQ